MENPRETAVIKELQVPTFLIERTIENHKIFSIAKERRLKKYIRKCRIVNTIITLIFILTIIVFLYSAFLTIGFVFNKNADPYITVTILGLWVASFAGLSLWLFLRPFWTNYGVIFEGR